MGTPGTGIGHDGDPSPALGASRATPAVVYVKAGRANNLPNGTVESWKPGDVATTLNVNDNTGDTRATVLQIDAPMLNQDTGCSCCPFDPKPDSARYRSLGNAVTVPTVAWVGRRMMQAHLDTDATWQS